MRKVSGLELARMDMENTVARWRLITTKDLGEALDRAAADILKFKQQLDSLNLLDKRPSWWRRLLGG